MTIRDEAQGELKKGESRRRGKLGTFLESIKFSHSIFALPFALATFFMAGSEGVSWSLLAKIVAACVLARTAAMSFNRLADARVDRLNPRTSSRAVPAGELSRTFMAGATITACCLFALCCWWINSLALYLCPLALLVLLGYAGTLALTRDTTAPKSVSFKLPTLGSGGVAVANMRVRRNIFQPKILHN